MATMPGLTCWYRSIRMSCWAEGLALAGTSATGSGSGRVGITGTVGTSAVRTPVWQAIVIMMSADKALTSLKFFISLLNGPLLELYFGSFFQKFSLLWG